MRGNKGETPCHTLQEGDLGEEMILPNLCLTQVQGDQSGSGDRETSQEVAIAIRQELMVAWTSVAMR